MATITKGYSFGATETVTSAKLSTLVDSASISNIVEADISNSAVTNIKINDVSGNKFTNLGDISGSAGVVPLANIPSIPGSSLSNLSSISSGSGSIPVANETFTSITTDINNVAWTDYSSTSTVTGWNSYTVKSIYYKKVGKLVFVMFKIDGSSDTTTASFTVPYSAATGISGLTIASQSYTVNNGTQETNGGIGISGSTVTLFRNPASSAWTAAYTTKHIQGQFWYEATT